MRSINTSQAFCSSILSNGSIFLLKSNLVEGPPPGVLAAVHLERGGTGKGGLASFICVTSQGCISWESQLQLELGGVNLNRRALLISADELTGA